MSSFRRRQRVLRLTGLCASLVLFNALAIEGAANPTGALGPLHDCLRGFSQAQCGTLTVPENRAIKGGRTLKLHFVRVPALKPSGLPIFVLVGGPGESAITNSGGMSLLFMALHDRHDPIYLDQRGTGRSDPLRCRLFRRGSDTLAQLFPEAAVRACRRSLAMTHDLNAYGSEAAADDLNDLRKAFGYTKISFYASSYGTTVALVYMRRHGRSIAAAFLNGVAPTFFKIPLPFPSAAQHSLNSLILACSLDHACTKSFPRFAHEFYVINERSKSGR